MYPRSSASSLPFFIPVIASILLLCTVFVFFFTDTFSFRESTNPNALDADSATNTDTDTIVTGYGTEPFTEQEENENIIRAILHDPSNQVCSTPDRRPTQFWSDRFDEINGALAQDDLNQKTNLLLIGDSITHYLEKYQSAAQYWHNKFGHLHPVNEGLSGDETQHVIYRLLNGQLDVNPDCKYVVLLIGTNNIGTGRSAECAVNGIATIINMIHKRLTKAKILLMNVFPRNHLWKGSPQAGKLRGLPAPSSPYSSREVGVELVNDIVTRLLVPHLVRHEPALRERIVQIDLFHKLTRVVERSDVEKEKPGVVWQLQLQSGAGSRDDGRLFALLEEAYTDGLHLSPKGYEIWADELEKYIID